MHAAFVSSHLLSVYCAVRFLSKARPPKVSNRPVAGSGTSGGPRGGSSGGSGGGSYGGIGSGAPSVGGFLGVSGGGPTPPVRVAEGLIGSPGVIKSRPPPLGTPCPTTSWPCSTCMNIATISLILRITVVPMRIFLEDSPEKRRSLGLKSVVPLRVLAMKRQSVAGMGAD